VNGRVIAVASGKGGVGKTWFSITLAQALAQGGAQVLLLDGDVGLANADVQLGLDPRRDLADVLLGHVSLAEAALTLPAGFALLPGRSGSGALAALDAGLCDRLLALLVEARGQYAITVLDLGAGLDPLLRRLAAAADTLLVLATDEPTSLTDAYAVLKLHRRDAPSADARLVVNQAADRPNGERTWTTLNKACESFLGTGVPLAGVVRRDPKVPEAIRRQTPLLTRHPNSPAAEDVALLAHGLLVAA
jgi:flagellar biosynthesis protein FlhG